MGKNIYLDNAATTFPKPEIVYNSMDKYLRNECVNAGRGSYILAQKSTGIIDETRELLLELVNCSDNGKVIFSPSATIATNQILRGLNWDKIKNVYVTPFEHNAIMRTLHSIKKKYDFNINIIPFNNISFELDEEELKIMYANNNPDLIIMSHISNVTGYILPIGKCHELAKNYNPINIVDCAQSLGLVEVNAKEEFKECDFIIFAGHKSLYGPFGIGGFYILNSKIILNEVITGGTGSDSTNLDMPRGNEAFYEPGSYNMQSIVGLNAAIKWLKNEGYDKVYTHKKTLSDKLIAELEGIEGIELYIPENLDKHVGVVSFNLENYSAEDIGRILSDDYNIAVRTGHHCAPLMGEFLDGYAVDGTVRVSVGYFNENEEVQKFLRALEEIIEG